MSGRARRRWCLIIPGDRAAGYQLRLVAGRERGTRVISTPSARGLKDQSDIDEPEGSVVYRSQGGKGGATSEFTSSLAAISGCRELAGLSRSKMDSGNPVTQVATQSALAGQCSICSAAMKIADAIRATSKQKPPQSLMLWPGPQQQTCRSIEGADNMKALKEPPTLVALSRHKSRG